MKTAEIEQLIAALAAAEAGETFNVYRDEDGSLDRPGAAAHRRASLAAYLETRAGAEVVLVGEAAGYQGTRFSGIAFTSERQLLAWGAPYEPSSLRLEGWAEPSATIVHRTLDALGAEENVLLWNACPFHPSRPGESLTNRRPSKVEVEAGRTHLETLLALVRPRLVVACGRVAQSLLGPEVPCVRHPANGGARAFAHGLTELLS